jgi:copper(I)-binding protein
MTLLALGAGTKPSTQPTTAPAIRITNAWARPARGAASVGAVFLKIENTSAETDHLLGASSAQARAVELHETIHDGQVMKMRPIESVVIGAGASIELKPGGLHFMLIGMQKDLPENAIELTLSFEHAGQQTVHVKVKDPESSSTNVEAHAHE